MDQGKDERAKVNPAARHDAPGDDPPQRTPPRTPDHQVTGGEGKDLNPLDPGGIGE